MFKLHLQNFARRTPGGDAPAGAA
ncbi:MAG: hypothetical protein FD160_2381, partial [Caulobacteraceae bacterium]